MTDKQTRILIRVVLVGALGGIIASLANYYLERGAKAATRT